MSTVALFACWAVAQPHTAGNAASVLDYRLASPRPFFAANTYFVRTDGSDATCNGLADASAASAPNCAFLTIEQGVATSASGDTVSVGPGTYNQTGTISLDKAIMLQGPNVGVSPNGGVRLPEAVITGPSAPVLRISSPGNGTVAGFTFDNTGVLDAYDPGLNITFRRNIFSNMTTQTFFFNSPALLAFDDNYLTNAAPDGDESLLVAGNWDGAAGTAVSITNNVWENTQSTGMNLSSVSGMISGNRFTNVSYYAVLLANNCGTLTVSNNLFDGIVNPDPVNVPTWGAGVRFYTPSFIGPIRIKSNTFKNSYVGVGVRQAGGDLTGQDVQVIFNRFINNNFGILHDGAGPLNGENNWWGCNYGPGGVGAACSGTPNGLGGAGVVNIDANPWLKLTSAAVPASVQMGANSAVTSKLTFNSDNIDTSGSGTVPNGTPATFVGTLGTVTPPSSVTAAGIAGTTFTAGVTAGAGGVATTIDAQSVNAGITVQSACAAVSIPATITTRRNVTVTAPIQVDDLTGKNAISFDFRLTYDPSVLTAPVVSNSGTLSSAMIITVNPNTPGLLIISGYDKDPLAGAGTLLNISFTASGPIGSSSNLNFTSFMFNEGNPCSTTTNGHVAIISGTVSGAITYSNAASPPVPVPNVVLSGAGSAPVSGNSDFSGLYSLNGFGPGSYTVTPAKTGDVNGITGFDSALIAQHVVELITLNATQLLAADVSQNGVVTSFDAALIAQYVVLIPNVGDTGTWKFTPVNRSYADVEADHINQDYGAILMGEVSGNWVAPTMFAPLVPARPDAPPLGVTAPHLNAVAGSNFTVPVSVQNTTGLGVISYQYDLTYDPAVIQPQSVPVSLTGTISEGMALTYNPISPGLLKVVVFGTNNLVGAGVLFNLKFTAVGPLNSVSPLTFSAYMFNEGNPLAGTTPGQIKIVGPTASGATVNGRLLTAFGQPVPSGRISLTDTMGVTRTALSSSLGFYEFDNLPSGQTYVISVEARRFVFSDRVMTVGGDMAGFDLVAEP